ncbi:MAG: hypothetical protein M1511_05885 [Deltaproteobacteria bacterium]|nr:hypothetical protein [Deltaproteobacteria bacterium]
MIGNNIGIWNPALGQMKLTRRAGKGDEYVGACPDCGGKDRFHVWPSDGETGRFWCRTCGRKGDGIDYLRWQHNMTFQQACDATGKTPTRRRTIKVDHSSWKVKKPITTYIPETPKVEQTVNSLSKLTLVNPVQAPSGPKLFSEKCQTCFNFDIDYDVAWCFGGGSYHNHKHLKSCPGFILAACKECEHHVKGWCTVHPRNQFVNIHFIEECPRPRKGD